MKRVKLLVSKCLLGEKVRYDGGHKEDLIIKEIFGKFVDFVPVCPETESGLPTPRDPLILVKDEEIKIVSKNNKTDYTPLFKKWIKHKICELKAQNIDGIVLKSKSPSCGLSVDIFDLQKKVVEKGLGIWAKKCFESFYNLPIVDEKAIYNFRIRENFLCSIFIINRWKKVYNFETLYYFHNSHKIFLKSKSKVLFQNLEELIKNPKEFNKTYIKYSETLNEILKKEIDENFFENLILEFKNYLPKNSEELINSYQKNYVNDVLVLEILRYWLNIYSIEELKNQFYLTPLPFEFDSKYINLDIK